LGGAGDITDWYITSPSVSGACGLFQGGLPQALSKTLISTSSSAMPADFASGDEVVEAGLIRSTGSGVFAIAQAYSVGARSAPYLVHCTVRRDCPALPGTAHHLIDPK
jgi:hypothetical protein